MYMKSHFLALLLLLEVGELPVFVGSKLSLIFNCLLSFVIKSFLLPFSVSLVDVAADSGCFFF
jgi:putative Ca2+/H+ antiporter (TMEM165/GDT1 family)